MEKMKKLLVLTFALAVVQLGQAQLRNTSWKGTFTVPEETDLVLQFKKDSLLVTVPDGNETVEIMRYKINNDTLSITKLYGRSSCDEGTAASYQISIKEKKLYVSPLKDNCDIRWAAWPKGGLEKIE